MSSIRSGARPRLTLFDNASASHQRSASVGMGLYSRDSYGGSKRASSEERKSELRWSGVRNSLSNEPKGATKDIRPLTDKAYQKKKTAEIVEFLESVGFDHPITQAKLMQPSKKEFELIFQFLVSTWDPSFIVKNLEEDAPRILKNLGYPFIPNKSVFTYVARTNFSSLLGILIYLMDLAQFQLNIDLTNILASGDSDQPEEHAILLKYFLSSTASCQEVEDEEKIRFFRSLIRGRNTDSISELEEQTELEEEKLRKVQAELEQMDTLREESNVRDTHINRYEEYLLEMDGRIEKKMASNAKLTEELNQKESVLRDVEEMLGKKQAVYDAQGFDGKKHLSFCEEQKKELKETLEKKKAVLRELQDECWTTEVQHSMLLDKGAELWDKSNELYSEIDDVAKSIVQTLQNIKDPEVQNVSNNFRVDIPNFQMPFNNRTLSACKAMHTETLEVLQKKFSTTLIIINAKISSISQELTGIKMEISQVSTKLKCASSTESKKSQDLINLEQQAVEEVKVLERKCDEQIKLLKKLREENDEKAKVLSEARSNLKEIKRLRENKTLVLEEYLKQQEKFFKQLKANVDTELNTTEKYGEQIAESIEKLMKEHIPD